MKIFIVLLSLIASAYAALVAIQVPSQYAHIQRGEPFMVSILKPDYIQSSTDIGVAITAAPCSALPCSDMSERLGDVLYAGGYSPTKAMPPPRNADYYEDFFVVAPTTLPPGPATLSVVHAGLIGAGPSNFVEIVNTTVFLL